MSAVASPSAARVPVMRFVTVTGTYVTQQPLPSSPTKPSVIKAPHTPWGDQSQYLGRYKQAGTDGTRGFGFDQSRVRAVERSFEPAVEAARQMATEGWILTPGDTPAMTSAVIQSSTGYLYIAPVVDAFNGGTPPDIVLEDGDATADLSFRSSRDQLVALVGSDAMVDFRRFT